MYSNYCTSNDWEFPGHSKYLYIQTCVGSDGASDLVPRRILIYLPSAVFGTLPFLSGRAENCFTMALCIKQKGKAMSSERRFLNYLPRTLFLELHLSYCRKWTGCKTLHKFTMHIHAVETAYNVHVLETHFRWSFQESQFRKHPSIWCFLCAELLGRRTDAMCCQQHHKDPSSAEDLLLHSYLLYPGPPAGCPPRFPGQDMVI
jgi:hypothetical protein